MTVLGLEAKLYYLKDDTPSGVIPGTIDPTDWQEIQCIRDLTLNEDDSLADASCRKGAGWRMQRGALTDGSVDFTLVYEEGDVAPGQFRKLRDMKTGKFAAFFAVMTGNIALAGKEGLWSWMEVTTLNETQSLEEVITFDVTLTVSPAKSGVAVSEQIAPAWVVIPTQT
jgi:hypothetical protein